LTFVVTSTERDNRNISEIATMNLPSLPSLPMSGRQTLAVLGLAAVVAGFVVLVYHYATRSPAEPGA
jgi:hypothetical protein